MTAADLPPRSLRTLRRDYTKGEIARVAMQLFARDGFTEVTVEQIADEVGISPRTFFRYFATKEDVVFHDDQRIRRRLVRALAARPKSEGAVTALRQAYLATSSVAPADREHVVMQSRVRNAHEPLRARGHGLQSFGDPQLVEMVAGRMGVDPARDPRPETIVVAISSVASAAFSRWVDGGGVGDASVQVAAAIELVERGLGSSDRAVG
jgi:AcrR family transcriptional regulator